jgi:glycosyltransferase involved in cell wall biosynthesis
MIILRNIVNSNIERKEELPNNGTFRIINIGRQIEGKNPLPIIEAMSGMKNAEMTIVGDGDLHEACCQLAETLGVSKKIKFIKSVPNNEIGALLKQFDVFVAQTSYPEYPKTIIEAQRGGLPVIINNSAHIAPEAQKSCMVVDDNKDGFKKGLELLQLDESVRKLCADKGYSFVRKNYDPENIIKQYKKILNV